MKQKSLLDQNDEIDFTSIEQGSAKEELEQIRDYETTKAIARAEIEKYTNEKAKVSKIFNDGMVQGILIVLIIVILFFGVLFVRGI